MSIPTDISVPPSQPQQQQQQQQSAGQQPAKRSSRRANTAERRATHNAVERLRRETLNGRFLDLAAMLPALAAQRRPSKSAIVNQSIALISSQRRSRIVAARELRLIKTENDALRQELNECRGRTSLPRVEEPPRSADLLALLAVEEEAEGEDMMMMMMNSRRAAFEMGEDDDYNDDGDDEQLSPESAHPNNAGPAVMTIPTIGHQVLAPVHHHHHQQQQQQHEAHYATVQRQVAVFEQQKAAMARTQMAARASYPQQQSQQIYPTENYFAGDMYAPDYAGATTWSQKAASTLATPPGTSHGHAQGINSEPTPYANATFPSTSPYGPHHHQSGLGVFKHGGQARSEDGDSVGESAGSSHFSSVSDLSASFSNGMVMAGGSSPTDHPFSFNMGMMNGIQMPMNLNMNMVPVVGMGMSGMGMGMSIPSPPHSVSPPGSQPQSRRPSLNTPASYPSSGNGGSKLSSPGPTSTTSQVQFAGMGLMV